MDYIGIESMKEAYAQTLVDTDITAALDIINSKIDEPIFKGLNVHPESAPKLDTINKALIDVYIDLCALDNELVNAGASYARMLKSMNNRLDSVETVLKTEKERLQDINIICGNYKDFVTVEPLTREFFSGIYSIKNSKTFISNSLSHTTLTPKIISISGNGYEGNTYVYSNGSPLKDSIDTSKQSNLVDSNVATVYEYSRLVCTDAETQRPPLANVDTKEAVCTIEMMNNTSFNTLKLSTDSTVIVEDVLTSDDGVTYTSCLSEAIEITDEEKKYADAYYVYGSNYLCFPSTLYLKLKLKSKTAFDESLAFVKPNASSPTYLKNSKRHVIRITDISLEAGTYAQSSNMQSIDLIGESVECIGIFANEYIPPTYPSSNSETYFIYTLTVNGVDHNIVPINSSRNGIKIIRHADYTSEDDYVYHINEKIKSAVLKIQIISDGISTPMLSNLKLCLGKAAV